MRWPQPDLFSTSSFASVRDNLLLAADKTIKGSVIFMKDSGPVPEQEAVFNRKVKTDLGEGDARLIWLFRNAYWRSNLKVLACAGLS
jgi:hypothetical protein